MSTTLINVRSELRKRGVYGLKTRMPGGGFAALLAESLRLSVRWIEFEASPHWRHSRCTIWTAGGKPKTFRKERGKAALEMLMVS